MKSIDAVSYQQKKAYLIELLSKISVIRRGEMTANMSGHTYPTSWRDCTRSLTEEEFKFVVSCASDFIVEPTVAQSGFNFGLQFYDFPEKRGAAPQAFFFISGEYLPKKEDHGFENCFRILSPISHNERNELLLRAFSLDLPKEKSHYEY